MQSLKSLFESTLNNSGLSASTAPFASLGTWDSHNRKLWFGEPYKSPYVRLAAGAVPAAMRKNNTLFSLMVRAGENPGQPFEAARLESIAVPASQQGKGIATQIMSSITRIADANRMWMWLEAVPFGDKPMSVAQLVDWYEAHGFRTITLGARPVMVRAPRN
jgi:GNAT superfamily N-acetyltransferase